MARKIIVMTFLVLSMRAESFVLRDRERTPKNLYYVKNIVAKYNEKDFRNLLRDFVKCCRPNRFPGSKGHAMSSQYLVDKIKQLDPSGKNVLIVDEFKPDFDKAIKLYQDDFKREIEGKYKPNDPVYKMWKGFTDSMVSTLNGLRSVKGKNVIWEKRGTINPEEIIIIGAHYDTIANDKNTLIIKPNEDMPGADDNGSGVAIALGMIEMLSEINIAKTVRIVFFDFEELGFLGSRAFVQKYSEELKSKDTRFAGYVNLEMLGNDSKRNDKAKKKGNMRVYIRKKQEDGHMKDALLADRLVRIGESITSMVKFEIVANSFNVSDHLNFWEAGFPAVTFSQNWEDDFNQHRYHTSNDFVETLNMKTLFNSFKYISGSIIAWSFDILK